MSATVGFQIILILATLLCSLIAGFLFAFVYGISEWPNGENELFIDGLLTGILSLIVIWLFIS
ncbi:MAG: hypothetical protein AAFZ35_18635, partial [Cyanobacteria bacterium J06649_12]